MLRPHQHEEALHCHSVWCNDVGVVDYRSVGDVRNSTWNVYVMVMCSMRRKPEWIEMGSPSSSKAPLRSFTFSDLNSMPQRWNRRHFAMSLNHGQTDLACVCVLSKTNPSM